MTPYELWFGKKPKLSFLVWGCDAYVKKFHPDKLKPKSEKCFFIEYTKETIGYTFYHKSEGKIFVAENGSFLEKEFLSKEVSGRKVELDEVTVPAPLLESSSSQKSVPVIPTRVRKLMMMIMQLQIKLLPNLVDQPEYVPHQSGTVTLFWKS